ncbi:MAG: ankyrin repeat domain-containing protein, partial [Phycisphaerae bacterium]|nr:ankyrin repeat domain-containing protein [Phycisphaerae bacterium]
MNGTVLATIVAILTCGSMALAAAIHDAAGDGDLAKVKEIVGADPEAVSLRDGSRMTALHWAVLRGRTEIVSFLLDAGAEVDARERNGFTPLHWAAQRGHREMVVALLDHGADVTAKDSYGDETPPDMAAWANQKDTAELLLLHGAKLSIFTAASLGKTEDVKRFLAEDPGLVHATMKQGGSPLHWAARGGAEVVELLLARGADPNAADRQGNTPLHFAADSGRADAAIVLLKAGADVNARGSSRWTPLLMAARQGRTAVAEVLVKAGARLTTGGDGGATPLWWAATWGHPETVAFLIDSGAKLADEPGILHAAAEQGKGEVVEVLLEKGADIDALDEKGRTALQAAAAAGQDEVVRLLLAKGATVDIFAASLLGMAERVGELLKENPDLVAAARLDGRTPLHVAAASGREKIVELLLVNGADVNAIDAEGKTPLHLAASAGHARTVELLLANGAAVEATDGEGWTPFFDACHLG